MSLGSKSGSRTFPVSTLASLESLTIPSVQEIILKADLGCSQCWKRSVIGDACDLKNHVKTAALRISSPEKKCCCAVAVEEGLWGSAVPLLVAGIAHIVVKQRRLCLSSLESCWSFCRVSLECVVPWPFLCVTGLVLFPEPKHEEEENRPSPESSPPPLRVTGAEAPPALLPRK
ncbi:hypothetical protein MRB53_027280 [Persea americana]|uniref:Uncharacterized protein n=1 Tax=Persea americana TaxID=3435 RepID=A0ACC2LLL7_PERAE|nr:hypothetical protein MRB53_027280 [Persea americana]